MTGINFFASTINLNILLHRGGHIIIAEGARTLFEGDQYFCMKKIRQIVDELSIWGDKTIIFNIQNMTVGDDSGAYFAKSYIKGNLESIKRSSRCKIEIKAGLYNVFA